MERRYTAPKEKAKREKPLRFLRYFLMANYKITNKDSLVREDEIYDWFGAKDNAKLCEYKEKPFEFVRKIIRNVESYLAFLEGKRQRRSVNGNIADGQPQKMSRRGVQLAFTFCCWRLANVPKAACSITSSCSWRIFYSSTSIRRRPPRSLSGVFPSGPTNCETSPA